MSYPRPPNLWGTRVMDLVSIGRPNVRVFVQERHRVDLNKQRRVADQEALRSPPTRTPAADTPSTGLSPRPYVEVQFSRMAIWNLMAIRLRTRRKAVRRFGPARLPTHTGDLAIDRLVVSTPLEHMLRPEHDWEDF